MMLKDKKGQLISSIIAGVAALVILVIVSFLIVDTLNGAGLIARSTNTTSETGTNLTDAGVTLVGCDGDVDGSINAISNVTNTTLSTINSANYSFTGCVLSATATSDFNGSLVNINYTYGLDSTSQVSVDNLVSNYTSGVDNVSEKLPTVLLITAVVLLFGAIVFLVNRSRNITATSGGSL